MEERTQALALALASAWILGCSPGAREDQVLSQVEPQGHVVAARSDAVQRPAARAEDVEPGPPAAQAAGLPAGALRLEKAVILDATGFEEPMVAATLFLPEGWRSEGGVQWGQQFLCTNGYVFRWSASSPDGLAQVSVLPQERWESNNIGSPPSTPGCQLAPYSSVEQYLLALIPRLEPGARVLGYRPRTDLQQQHAQYNSVTPMPMGESRTWVDAGEVSFTFAKQGKSMRASVAAVAVFSLMRTDAGMGVMESLSASTFPCYAASAPGERFDAGLFEAIRRSIQVDARWNARISSHNATIAQVALRESQKRSEMLSRANEEIARIREEAWSAHQESSDRRFREFGEALRGVETYRDVDAPASQVELSSMYEHAWRLNDGSYVLTDDAGFEPYRDLGLQGNKLDAVR